MDKNIIIVGGGCAGMQLINSLLQLPYEQTGDILLIEKQAEQPKKSWCFWAKEPTVYDSLVSKKWSIIKFSSTDVDLVKSIHPYQYKYIKSEDFFDYHYQLIDKSPRVTLVKAEVKEIVEEQNQVRVYTDQQEYTAALVYDGRVDFEAIPTASCVLWQHFKGYFIETTQDVFEVDTATMMDFNIDQAEGAHFMYVLPFAANRALVEFTAFSALPAYSDDRYEFYLKTYIKKRFNVDYHIKSVESGKIPMTDFDFKPQHSNTIISIGSAAGAIKPTTGYAFNRIRKDTEELIDNFTRNTKSRRGVFRKKRFRFYDKLLLKIIRDEPSRVKQVMERLFKRNPFPRILDFLDERSSLQQEITIFSKLPIRLFLKQVYKYVFAR